MHCKKTNTQNIITCNISNVDKWDSSEFCILSCIIEDKLSLTNRYYLIDVYKKNTNNAKQKMSAS